MRAVISSTISIPLLITLIILKIFTRMHRVIQINHGYQLLLTKGMTIASGFLQLKVLSGLQLPKPVLLLPTAVAVEGNLQQFDIMLVVNNKKFNMLYLPLDVIIAIQFLSSADPSLHRNQNVSSKKRNKIRFSFITSKNLIQGFVVSVNFQNLTEASSLNRIVFSVR